MFLIGNVAHMHPEPNLKLAPTCFMRSDRFSNNSRLHHVARVGVDSVQASSIY